eukprot:3326508-Pleurochrysis_carterae.AAC.1
MKGHTFTLLDQSFGTLVKTLKRYALYTVSRMMQLLTEYNVVENREVHCVWDFKEWLEPNMHPIRGFATSQFGDGMHEFILRKDAEGAVRVHFRKSSQASTWLPKGPGYAIFKLQPDVEPPLAKLKPDNKWDRSTVE